VEVRLQDDLSDLVIPFVRLRELRGTTSVRLPGWTESFLAGMQRSIVFVTADVRHGSIKRVAASRGRGATAVVFVHEYLRSN